VPELGSASKRESISLVEIANLNMPIQATFQKPSIAAIQSPCKSAGETLDYRLPEMFRLIPHPSRKPQLTHLGKGEEVHRSMQRRLNLCT
jgi:hypothetical protein